MSWVFQLCLLTERTLIMQEHKYYRVYFQQKDAFPTPPIYPLPLVSVRPSYLDGDSDHWATPTVEDKGQG